MLLLTLHLSWIEIIVLFIGALTLGCTLYFFYTSQRSLQQALRGGRNPSVPAPVVKSKGLNLLPRNKTPEPEQPASMAAASGVPKAVADDASVGRLKESFREQQRTIQTLLQRVAQLEHTRQEAANSQPLLQRIRDLETALHQKEAALSSAKEQEPMVAELSARLDEVYHQFGMLQQQGVLLQKQASAASELAIRLEDLQHAYDTVKEELQLKETQVEQLRAENFRLQQELLVHTKPIVPPVVPSLYPVETATATKDITTERRSLLQQQLQRITELESLIEQFGATTR